jgi:hypothetical protein
LGVFSTFTIPKIISAQENSKRKAVFREVIAAMSAAQHNAIADGSIDTVGTYQLFSTKVNAIKLCPTASNTTGCWPQTAPNGEVVEGGFIMHNGATIAGLSNNYTSDNFLVDWNGPAEPNLAGDDQIMLSKCYRNVQSWCRGQHDIITVVTSAGWGGGPAHIALWESIFSD